MSSTIQRAGGKSPIRTLGALLDWSNAPVATEIAEFEVTENGDITGLGKYTPTVTGCYTYTETLTVKEGDQPRDEYVHEPGHESQTALVQKQPKIASQMANGVYPEGSILVDNVIVTEGVPGAKAEITVTWYGPMQELPADESETAPEGVPAFDTATASGVLNDDGALTIAVNGTKRVERQGYYVAVEHIAADRDAAQLAATGSFGRIVESAVVPRPDVRTQVNKQLALVGEELSDTVIVSGILPFPNTTYTLAGALLGPVAPVDGQCYEVNWDNAPEAAKIDPFDITENGSISDLGKFTPEVTGCYTYTETLTVKEDGVVRFVVTHTPGHTSQTALVRIQPEIDSKMKNIVYEAGSKLTDTVMVTNAVPGGKANIKVDWYGPFEAQPEASVFVPEDAVLFDTGVVSSKIGEDGTLTIEVEGTKSVTDRGYYVAVEHIEADRDVAQLAATGTFGRLSETAIVPNPTIATQVNHQIVYPGATLTDDVEVDGIIPLPGVGYTLTGKLLGPVTPVDGLCKDIDWTDAPVATEIGPMEVTENGTITEIGPFTVKEVGCYTYTETLTVFEGDTPRVTVDHEPGQESQTALVTTPEIATQTSRQLALPGMTVVDTIKVTNPADYTGTMRADLVGPLMPADGAQCSAVTDDMWRAALADGTVKVVHSEDIVIEKGVSEYTTGEAKIDEISCYTWYEHALFDAPFEYETETPYGVDTETTLVIQPTISTVAKSTTEYVGAKFTDEITLEGTHDQPGTLTGSILYSAMPEDGNCLAVDWANAEHVFDIDPINTTGDGVYNTNGIDVGKVGCYTFTITWTSAADAEVYATSPAGEPTETMGFRRFIASGIGGFDDVASPQMLAGLGLLALSGVAGAGWLVYSRRRNMMA